MWFVWFSYCVSYACISVTIACSSLQVCLSASLLPCLPRFSHVEQHVCPLYRTQHAALLDDVPADLSEHSGHSDLAEHSEHPSDTERSRIPVWLAKLALA